MKKKTMITVLGLIVGLHCLFAQTSKGTFSAGVSTTFEPFNQYIYPAGGFSFGSVQDKSDDPDFEDEKSKFRTVNVKPRFGYFVANRLAMGLDLQALQTWQRQGDFTITTNTLMFGPFLRYYIPANKVLLFLETSGRAGQFTLKAENPNFEDSESKQRSNLMQWSTAAGASFPLSNRFTFDVQTGYDFLRSQSQEDNPDNERSIMRGMSLQLGFTFFFPKA